MLTTVLALGFAGVGISINALGVKTSGAAISDRLENRSRLFALISVSINISAATAAPIALFFVERKLHEDVLLAVAALYVLAGAVTFANRAKFPAGQRVVLTWSLDAYLTALREPGLLPFFFINTFFWIISGQLFTVSEMMFMPSGDTLIVGLIPERNRAVGYSIFAVSTAVGEALGGGLGVATYRWLGDSGHGRLFWLAAAGLAVVFAAITGKLRRSSVGLRSTVPAR